MVRGAPGGAGASQCRTVRVLFVCSGNICRSPTAEAVFAHLAAERGVDAEADGAGIGGWHVGEPPDRRSAAEAARRGVALRGVGRQVGATDFDDFDLIVACDRSHATALHRLAPDADAAGKVRLLREWDEHAAGDLDVPDPYYGGDGGFAHVYDVIERSCGALLDELEATP
jgi:protein-tyrosine phosphatase